MWYDINCDTGGMGVICQEKGLEPAKGKYNKLLLSISSPEVVLDRLTKMFSFQTLKLPTTGKSST